MRIRGPVARASRAAATVANNSNSDPVYIPNDISNNSSRVASHVPWVFIRLWMVNPKKSTAVISGTEGGFDEQGDGKDGRSRIPEGEALEANDEDYSDCTILFPTIVSYSTLTGRPHHLIQVQRPNDSIC